MSEQRVSYDDVGLTEADLERTPLAQFRRWYADAVAAGVPEPNAMTVATVDGDGLPSARTVLLKEADARGFVFFTNYASRKGEQLARQPRAALVFPWLGLQRQVTVRGLVERVPEEESAAYFASRPWGSRIGAWASRQSQPAASRDELEAAYAEYAARWPEDVPLPPHWGGFVVRPLEVEFWAGRPSRLHDRLVYTAAAGTPLDAAWTVTRRQP